MTNKQYRVWDSEEQEYKDCMDDFYLDQNGTLMTVDMEGCFEVIFDQGRYAVEFYICRDQDNKPVYEGDIVQGGNGFIGGVVDQGDHVDVLSIDGNGNWLNNLMYDGIKVIGNVHQNYDLLEKNVKR